MINPMILKIALSLLDGKKSPNIRPVKSVTHNGHFLSDMMKALNAGRKKSFNLANGSERTGVTSDKKEYGFYLESFRKALAAKGISPDKAFLNEKDLPLIKGFLFECGFSKEKVERFIKDLKESNPSGDIKLSRLFLKINEMGAPDGKKDAPVILESSAVPYIESILRDHGLSPKAADDVINAAKVSGGGLDLNRLVAKLKKINGNHSINYDGREAHKSINVHNPFSSMGESHPDNIEHVSRKADNIGIHRLNSGEIDRTSMENLISSLEQMAGNQHKENKLSPEMKETLDRIISKISSSSKKTVSPSSIQIRSNSDFVDSMPKKHKSRWEHSVKHESVSAFLGKEESIKEKNSLFHPKEKGGVVATYDRQNSAASHHFSKAESLFGPNGNPGLNNSVQQEELGSKSGGESIEIPINSPGSNYTETMNTIERGETPLRGNLPGYLMDQIGKQISRSLLRGDRIIRLQLKPPELGMVKIKMDIKDHTLKLGMITEHSSVKELLLSNIHELKAALVQQGLRLERLDVQINYNFGQTPANSKEGMDNGQRWGRDFKEKESISVNRVEGAHLHPMKLSMKNNLLDLVA